MDRIEVIPVGEVVADVCALVPPTTVISVTSLPHHRPETTITVARALARKGYRVVPHLAANQIGSERELDRLLAALTSDGIHDVFVVGGDGARRGATFADGGTLLRRLRDVAGESITIGVPSYPQEHPHMTPARVLEVVRSKSDVADYLVTQMCFDPLAVSAHLRDLHGSGVLLPVWVGVAGAVRLTKLLAIAARIGVQPSLSFAFSGGSPRLPRTKYSPTQLIESVVADAAATGVPPAGFHLYSFNQFALFGPQIG